MVTGPDDVHTVADAAEVLRKSPRTVQRMLERGELDGVRRQGGWRIPALSVWRYLGIERQMIELWLDYCRRREADAAAAEAGNDLQEFQ